MEYIETCGDGYRVVAFLLWSADESLFFFRFYISEKVKHNVLLCCSQVLSVIVLLTMGSLERYKKREIVYYYLYRK